MLAMALVPCTISAPPLGWSGRVVAHDVRAPGRLEMRGDARAASRSGTTIGGRVRCSTTMGASERSAAASSTGTSLYSQGWTLMTLPAGKSCITAGS